MPNEIEAARETRSEERLARQEAKMAGDIDKLPKWAREEIELLRRRVAEKDDEISILKGRYAIAHQCSRLFATSLVRLATVSMSLSVQAMVRLKHRFVKAMFISTAQVGAEF
jgi:FPC/CPF motif-containing protein YcgG